MKQGSGQGFSAHRIVHGVGNQDMEESLLPVREEGEEEEKEETCEQVDVDSASPYILLAIGAVVVDRNLYTHVRDSPSLR